MRRALAAIVVVAATLVAVVGSASASAATVSTRAARREIARLVAAGYAGLPFGNVACPPTVVRTSGSTFTCTVQLAGGFLVVEVTQADARGTVTLATPQAVLTKSALEQFVAANASVTATVDCGPSPWLVRRPGQVLACSASLADGSVRNVELTVRDTDGNVTITAVT